MFSRNDSSARQPDCRDEKVFVDCWEEWGNVVVVRFSKVVQPQGGIRAGFDVCQANEDHHVPHVAIEQDMKFAVTADHNSPARPSTQQYVHQQKGSKENQNIHPKTKKLTYLVPSNT